jgi:hypothetical protein
MANPVRAGRCKTMNYFSRQFFGLLMLGLFSFPAQSGELDSRAMEALLVKSLNSVGSNRLDAALNEVDALLKINPNFKLAQMLKGDLLMARAKPLSGFGNDPDVPSDRMNDLRDEARARLQRVQQQPVTTAPRFIWQLNPQQRYAIVVDTSKSTLYLYENVNGAPRYVENFYISVGKKGSDKNVEGDQKTPLGVYFVNAHLSKQQLTDFYGSGAYPINYPGAQRSRHLAARHTQRHLQPPAACQQWLRGAFQRRFKPTWQVSASGYHPCHHYQPNGLEQRC